MKRILSTSILALFMLCGAQAQQKTKFKVNPEIGKSLNYDMILKTDIEGAQDIVMDMSMKMTMQATSATDTSITLEAKYSQLKMDMNMGMIMMSYDSSKEPDNEMSKAIASQLKPLLDAQIDITMDRQGNVKNIIVPNVSEQVFDKSNLKSVAMGFPNKEIGIGDTWSSKTDLAQIGVNADITNRLVEKNNDGYKVEVNGIFLDSSGKQIGTQSGYYIIDAKTHFTKFSETKTELTMMEQKIINSSTLRLIP